MPIIVTQAAVTSPSSSATTTVQQIMNCTSQDVRSQLATNSATLLDYVNRTSLEILRTSRWKFLLAAVQQFSTVIGSKDYWIGALGANPAGTIDTTLNLTDVRNVKRDGVFDRTNFRRLQKTDEAPLIQSFSNNARPRLFRNDVSTPNIISIYPPSDAVYTIEFRYYKIFAQLSVVGQILQIPDDYKDVVCSGVNWLGYQFLQKVEDAQIWHQMYQMGIQTIIRDANLFPRGGEFIYPDPATTTRIVQTGLGLDSGIETSIP